MQALQSLSTISRGFPVRYISYFYLRRLSSSVIHSAGMSSGCRVE